MHCSPLREKILEAVVYANVDAPIALQLAAASAFNVERNIRCLAQLIFQACAILYAPAAEAVLVMRCASVGAHRRRQIAAEIIYRRSLHFGNKKQPLWPIENQHNFSSVSIASTYSLFCNIFLRRTKKRGLHHKSVILLTFSY